MKDGLQACLVAVLMVFGCRQNPMVAEVVSADTVVLDDGTEVRYAGVEAVGADDPWFEASRIANAYLVNRKAVILVAEPAAEKKSAYYVYTPIFVEGEKRFLFVNAELVRHGFVRALPVDGSCGRRDLWESLWLLQEKEAKELELGIWRGDMP